MNMSYLATMLELVVVGVQYIVPTRKRQFHELDGIFMQAR